MKIVVSSGIVEGAPIVVCCKHEDGVIGVPRGTEPYAFTTSG